MSGYSNNIDGIPLPGSGDMPQIQSSAAPNREDTPDFTEKGEPESDYPNDYFDAEEERLGDPLAPYEANKDDSRWSEGIEDEENLELEKNEDTSGEGVFPETQPLHVEGRSDEQTDEEFSGRQLEPDNIQHGTGLD